MKRTITVITVIALLATTFVACKHKGPHHPPCNSPSLVPVDSANKMIFSYLNSINYPTDDSNVVSFTLDADALRYLLDSMPSSPTIQEVQVRLAHDLDYINSGHGNEDCGYSCKALTVLMNGVDVAGGSIYIENGVINHARPCPKTCPEGDAASPLYVTPPTRK